MPLIRALRRLRTGALTVRPAGHNVRPRLPPTRPLVAPIHTHRIHTKNGEWFGLAAATCVVVALSVQQWKQAHCSFSFNLFADSDSRKDAGTPLGRYSVSVAAEAVADSVVNVTVEYPEGGRTMVSSGSGIVWDPQGHVVTNAHVVADAHPHGKVLVRLRDGREYPAKLLHKDGPSDIALLEVTSQPDPPLLPAPMGVGCTLRPGEWVMALGCPFGLESTITLGIVSGLHRQDIDLGEGMDKRLEFIQVDMAINTGNSGGPLVSLDGVVVGINTVRVAEGQGISFAISIDNVREIVDTLLAHGNVPRPFLGLGLVSWTLGIRQQLEAEYGASLANSVPPGVVVTSVVEGSPAAHAQFHRHDVVAAVDGKPVATVGEMLRQVGYRVGHPVTCDVSRIDCDHVSRLNLVLRPGPRRN